MYGPPFMWDLYRTFPHVVDVLRPWCGKAREDVIGDDFEQVEEAEILIRLDDERAMLADVALPSVTFATEYLALVADTFDKSWKGNFPLFAIAVNLRTSLVLSARTIWILQAATRLGRQERCASVLREEWKRERQSWEDIQKVAPEPLLSEIGERLGFIKARRDAIGHAFPAAPVLSPRYVTDTDIVGDAGAFVDEADSPAKGLEGFTSIGWKNAGLHAWRTGSGWAHGLQWPLGLQGNSLAAYPVGYTSAWFANSFEVNYKAAYVFLEVAMHRLAEALGLDPPPASEPSVFA